VTLSATPPAAPAQQPNPQQQQPTVDVKALQDKIAALESDSAESKRAAQYWAEKARTSATPPPKEKEPEAEPETDMLDLIASRGAKGLDEFLVKRGYTKASDVENRVNSKVAEVTKERQLMEQYPDLKKEDSDFFKATAGVYGELKKRGFSTIDAMELAAERTELQFLKTGKLKTPDQQKSDAKAQKEADRLARITAQGGERGNRVPVDSEEDDDDTPSADELKSIKFLADSLEIPMEEAQKRYIARAKGGTNMTPGASVGLRRR
jgi:hypothetical protein